MSHAFTFNGAHTNPDYEAYQYTHQSGLTHFNIREQSETGRYSGALFVKTPSKDDSGIAHALEHLVFRQSQAFPDSTTLFQLLALTDIQINASTLNGVTCFHFSSSCRDYFYLAARYLLSGMLNPTIQSKHCLEEIFDGESCGVIYRELFGYQNNANYLHQLQVLRGDQSPQRIACYGGTTDTLVQISLDKLKQYHQRYYHCNNIELITSYDQVENLHNELEPLLAKYDAKSSQFEPTKAIQACSNSENIAEIISGSDKVFSWWISIEFFHYIKRQLPELRKMATRHGVQLLPLSNESNSEDKFALRILARDNQIESFHDQLISTLDTRNAYAQGYCVESGKHPDSIGHLMNFYYSKLHGSNGVDPQTFSCQIKQPPHVSQLAHVAPTPNNAARKLDGRNRNPDEQVLSRVIPQLIETPTWHSKAHYWQNLNTVNLSKDINARVLEKLIEKTCSMRSLAYGSKLLIETNNTHHSLEPYIDHLITQHPSCKLPELPQLLHPLIEQLEQGGYQAVDHHCWLYRIAVPVEYRIIAQLSQYLIQSSAQFLRPRIQGECYVISSLYCEHSKQLYFYSVFDCQPNQRRQHITQALQGIADDSAFLKQALPLIKNKLINQHPIQSGALNPTQLAQLEQDSNEPLDSAQLEKLLKQVSETCIRHFLFRLTNEIINRTSHIQG